MLLARSSSLDRWLGTGRRPRCFVEAGVSDGFCLLPDPVGRWSKGGLAPREPWGYLVSVAESGATFEGANGSEVELGYRLAAAGREAAEDERLSLLEELFDPLSRRRRELVRPGWRCLEVGAGRGSMAVWLAEQVGPAGHVVATDVDTRYLERLDVPNLDVVEQTSSRIRSKSWALVRSISSARA